MTQTRTRAVSPSVRLLLALAIGCAAELPPECEPDELGVQASFEMRPELQEGTHWLDEPCSVGGVARGIHSLQCPGLIGVVGTSTINLFVFTQPPLESPLDAGDAITFSYLERIGGADRHFALRRAGRLALAGLASIRLEPATTIPAAEFYAPFDPKPAPLECGTESSNCGDAIRGGLVLSTTAVYGHQFRQTDDWSIWLERANSFLEPGNCLGTYHQLIIAAR